MTDPAMTDPVMTDPVMTGLAMTGLARMTEDRRTGLVMMTDLVTRIEGQRTDLARTTGRVRTTGLAMTGLVRKRNHGQCST
jgi:hypothetical protein